MKDEQGPIQRKLQNIVEKYFKIFQETWSNSIFSVWKNQYFKYVGSSKLNYRVRAIPDKIFPSKKEKNKILEIKNLNLMFI